MKGVAPMQIWRDCRYGGTADMEGLPPDPVWLVRGLEVPAWRVGLPDMEGLPPDPVWLVRGLKVPAWRVGLPDTEGLPPDPVGAPRPCVAGEGACMEGGTPRYGVVRGLEVTCKKLLAM